MSYMDEYPKAMDFVREKLGLPTTVGLYEAVVRFVSEYKKIEEDIQKLEEACLKSQKTKSKSKK